MHKPLDKDSVRRVFQCAREIVLAYGPDDIPQSARTALCEMMTHYENIALTDNPASAYNDIRDVPTELLAHNFVGTLILAKGNINKWDEMTKLLIRGLRGEPEPVDGSEQK